MPRPTDLQKTEESLHSPLRRARGHQRPLRPGCGAAGAALAAAAGLALPPFGCARRGLLAPQLGPGQKRPLRGVGPCLFVLFWLSPGASIFFLVNWGGSFFFLFLFLFLIVCWESQCFPLFFCKRGGSPGSPCSCCPLLPLLFVFSIIFVLGVLPGTHWVFCRGPGFD